MLTRPNELSAPHWLEGDFGAISRVLCCPEGSLPPFDAVVFARGLVKRPGPAGSGRGSPRKTPGVDQRPDRPGTALTKCVRKADRAAVDLSGSAPRPTTVPD